MTMTMKMKIINDNTDNFDNDNYYYSDKIGDDDQ